MSDSASQVARRPASRLPVVAIGISLAACADASMLAGDELLRLKVGQQCADISRDVGPVGVELVKEAALYSHPVTRFGQQFPDPGGGKVQLIHAVGTQVDQDELVAQPLADDVGTRAHLPARPRAHSPASFKAVI